MTKSILAALAVASLLVVTGCSGVRDTTPEPAVAVTPSVSVPEDTVAPEPAEQENFAAAVRFAELVHDSAYDELSKFVASDSPAARYVVHQLSTQEAQELDGSFVGPDSGGGFTVEPNRAKRTIRVESLDGDVAYTWKDFAYDAKGKIRTWNNGSGPLDEALWTRRSKDSAMGTEANLISAYRSSGGNLIVVVEASTSRAVSFAYDEMATYLPKSGYRQKAFAYTTISDLNKGEKTLLWYEFKKAKLGGTLTIHLYNEKTYDEADLKLKIK